jgi:Spy/CpxP family protein refolding chaperone
MSKIPMIFAVIALAGLSGLVASAARAQSAPPSPASELGSETGNWGLAPFAAIPTFAVRPEDRAAIRAMEDQHIKERRAFEDKYEAELRALIRKQAEEREALRARLSASH